MVGQLRLRQNRQRMQVITLLLLVIHHNRKVISHNLFLMAINLLMTKSLKTISRMKKRAAINQRVRLRSTSFRLPKA
ncbi:hypothetical protein ExPECSC067_04639 [Escherichia coli]|nr:hypothetical protein ExPECSC067_04639 [Escherichia coli]